MDKVNPPGPAILIVDDNPQNLQVLGNLLLEEKYEIEFAVNGEATLDWLKNRQFDLILLDINMPGMNGFEVCKRIRSDKDMCEVPIIFLSAESERESKEDRREAEFWEAEKRMPWERRQSNRRRR